MQLTRRWSEPFPPCANCATPLPIQQSLRLSLIRAAAPVAEIYAEARTNPLWAPRETVLAAQVPCPQGNLDPHLRGYILLITIPVAFLEATAQQLEPFKPPVVMGFSGVMRQWTTW